MNMGFMRKPSPGNAELPGDFFSNFSMLGWIMPNIRKKIFTPILFLIVCLVGLTLSCRATFFSGFHRIETNPGDPRLINYILEHGYLWLKGSPLHTSFWDPPFFFPAKNVLAYSEILVGTAPLYWLFRGLGFFPDTSYQLWTLGLLTLNFFVCGLVFRQIGFSLFAAIAASYLFAFSNMRVAWIGDTQLVPQFFTLCAILALFKLFRQESRMWGTRLWILVFAAAMVLQFYSGFYLGWFASL